MTYSLHINGKLILSGCLIINPNKELLLLCSRKWNHYETPGGKVSLRDCSDPNNIPIDDLARTATRELCEELGGDIVIDELKYFGKTEFRLPNSKSAIAHKFTTSILYGIPIVNEPEKFSCIDWLPINHLDKYHISPDLVNLLPKLKNDL